MRYVLMVGLSMLLGCRFDSAQPVTAASEFDVSEHCGPRGYDEFSIQVRYLVIASYEREAVAVPGYFEPASKTFHPWDDLLLLSKKLPGWEDPRHSGSPFLWNGIIVGKQVEPCIAYVVVDRNNDRVVQPGYWDWSNRAFYQWNGVFMDEAQWNELVRRNDSLSRWRRVERDSIQYLQTLDVPRYHARWAVQLAGLSGSAGQHGVRVMPDTSINASMTVVPVAQHGD